MDIEQYSANAIDTATYPDNNTSSRSAVDYCLFGLLGESGELANKWKKLYRDDVNEDDLREAMLEELGDVLWYTARLAEELGSDLVTVARRNVNKLQSRSRRGKIHGSGDDR